MLSWMFVQTAENFYSKYKEAIQNYMSQEEDIAAQAAEADRKRAEQALTVKPYKSQVRFSYSNKFSIKRGHNAESGEACFVSRQE